MIARLLARLRAVLTFCLHCLAVSLGLHLVPRAHKRKIHLAVLALIAYDLIHVGAKLADLGFLLLSFLMEAEDAVSHPSEPRRYQRASERELFHANTLALDRQLDRLLIANAAVLVATLKQWARTQGVRIMYADLDANTSAESSPRTKQIRLSHSLTDSQAFYTLLHELGHVFGKMSQGDGPITLKDYIFGETEAERIAQLTMRGLGITALHIADVYYKNKAYAAGLPVGMIGRVIRYVTPSAQAVADRLISVLGGNNHAS